MHAPNVSGWNHKEVEAGKYVGAEAHDRISIDLPPPQRRLANDILDLGKPVIILLLNGGSVDIGPELARADAAIEAFYPGLSGATVIANAIFGHGPESNRFGRMPYTTYPASFVNQTSMLEHDMSKFPGRTHQYYRGTPVVPFGFGLSYSVFEMELEGPQTITVSTGQSNTVTVTLAVTNHGPMVGDCVVLVFMRPKSMPRQTGSRLIQKLIGFERIPDLAPGLDARVSFTLSAETIAIADMKTGDLVQTPGSFELAFSDGSGDEVVVTLRVIGGQYIVEEFPSVD